MNMDVKTLCGCIKELRKATRECEEAYNNFNISKAVYYHQSTKEKLDKAQEMKQIFLCKRAAKEAAFGMGYILFDQLPEEVEELMRPDTKIYNTAILSSFRPEEEVMPLWEAIKEFDLVYDFFQQVMRWFPENCTEENINRILADEKMVYDWYNFTICSSCKKPIPYNFVYNQGMCIGCYSEKEESK